MNKTIENAINILIDLGVKRKDAEMEFDALSEPQKEAQKIIKSEVYAEGAARDIMFFERDFDEDYKRILKGE